MENLKYLNYFRALEAFINVSNVPGVEIFRIRIKRKRKITSKEEQNFVPLLSIVQLFI